MKKKFMGKDFILSTKTAQYLYDHYAKDLPIIDYHCHINPEEIAALNQSGATEDVYLTQLTGGVPQRIRMYIWLEGQDVDCINSAAAGSFAISLELAGSNET